MGEIDTERRITEIDQRSKSNEHRIEELIDRQNNFEKLTISVEVMTRQMQTFESTLSEVKADVRSLMAKPGKRWDAVVEKVLMLLIAAVVAFALTKIGL